MALSAHIYRWNIGDCSNGGISGKVDQVVIVNAEGPDLGWEGVPRVAIVHRERYPAIAVPVDEDEKPLPGAMAGGAFIYSQDSRFPFDGPISLHDRFEP